MFKITKYFPLLFLIISVIFSSCDGRDKAYRSTQNDLIENKVLDTFTEPIRYYPKEYTEMVTDTILSNGYIITVKMYSDMDSYITVISEVNGIKQQTNYRDFSIDVKVVKNGETILIETFNKQHNTVAETFSIDLNSSYLRDSWVAENNKHYPPNIPAIYFEYYSPITKESSIMEIVPLEDRYLDFIL